MLSREILVLRAIIRSQRPHPSDEGELAHLNDRDDWNEGLWERMRVVEVHEGVSEAVEDEAVQRLRSEISDEKEEPKSRAVVVDVKEVEFGALGNFLWWGDDR